MLCNEHPHKLFFNAFEIMVVAYDTVNPSSVFGERFLCISTQSDEKVGYFC